MARGYMDPETRQRTLERAWAAKREKAAMRKANKDGVPGVRSESSFHEDDRTMWTDMARSAGLRLPKDSNEGCTTARMHQFLTRAGIPKASYNAWWGMNIKQTIDANPDWPLRAWAGIVVEHREAILAS